MQTENLPLSGVDDAAEEPRICLNTKKATAAIAAVAFWREKGVEKRR